MDYKHIFKSTLTVLILMSGLAGLGFLGGCPKQPQREKTPNIYTGSKACKECHEEVYNGWKATFHAYKFQPVSDDFVLGNFTKTQKVKSTQGETLIFKKANKYFITTPDLGGQPATYPVKYVIGSIWKQRYLTEFDNGEIHILPVQWNVKTKEWVEYKAISGSGKGKHWGEKGKSFQFKCLGCHSTNAQVEETALFLKTSWTELGVGCESCHGPGKNHILAKIPEKSSSILNPAKLADPVRAGMVCGACHTRGGTTNKKYAYPVDYKPGRQLNFLFDEKPGMYPDGSPKEHHQQYNDWKSSGHQRSGVMCWDCHSPHAKGKSNKFQLKLPGSLLCVTCHQVRPQGAHSLHSTNNCIGCHMPNTVQSATPGDLRSHKFTVIHPSLTVEAGSVSKQPNSCNTCHYHKDYEPDRLVHFLKAAQKPPFCKECHEHKNEELDD